MRLYAQIVSKGTDAIMRFLLKRPRFWGSFCIAIAMIGSNAGSAWAGAEYRFWVRHHPGRTALRPVLGSKLWHGRCIRCLLPWWCWAYIFGAGI